MNTNHNKSYVRLKWKPVSARESQRLNEQGLSSSIPQEPGFLKDLPPDSAVTVGVHYPVRSQYAYSNIAQLLSF
jgi:hypothetical protein